MTLFKKPALIRQGYRALENQNYPAAIKYLNAATHHSEGEVHAELSHALAQAYYRNGDFKSATKAYGDAIISSSKKVQIDAQYNMANALFRTAVADFDPPNDTPFDQYLENAIRGDKQEKKLSEIDSIKKTLQNSISKYSETLNINSAHPQALKNKKTAEELLKSIEEIQEKIKKEKEEKKQEEDKKNKEEDKKKGDNKEKDKEDKKEGEEKEGEEKGKEGKPQDNKKGSEKTDPGKEGKDKPQEKDAKKGDSEGDNKEKSESDKEGKPKDNKPGEGKDSKQENPEKMEQSEDSKAIEKGEFESEKEALEFMKRMSDQRKKPNSRRHHSRNPSNDW